MKLEFVQKPDYNHCRKLFEAALKAEKVKPDDKLVFTGGISPLKVSGPFIHYVSSVKMSS